MKLQIKIIIFNIIVSLITSSFVSGLISYLLPEVFLDSYFGFLLSFVLPSLLVSFFFIQRFYTGYTKDNKSIILVTLIPLIFLVTVGPFLYGLIITLFYYLYCLYSVC